MENPISCCSKAQQQLILWSLSYNIYIYASFVHRYIQRICYDSELLFFTYPKEHYRQLFLFQRKKITDKEYIFFRHRFCFSCAEENFLICLIK